jgi:DHA1 family bicyclomycin/chloramphenicol resistance-like MFS transporter
MLKPDTLALTMLLGLLTALGPLSTDMYLPSLPTIASALQTSTAAVQLTLSVFLIGFAAGQVIYGPLADRHGRKPPLIAGLVLFTAASIGCAVAPTIEILVAMRFLQALGASGPIVLARTVVRDLYEGPRAGRELSRMGTIMGFVPAAAPVLGGVMHTVFGWQSTFLFCALFGLIAIAVVVTKLPETIRSRSQEALSLVGILRGFAVLTRHRGFLAYMALLSLTYGGLFAYISASSFVLQGVYRLSEFAFGIAFAIGVLGYIAGTLLAQRIVPRLGLARTIGLGVVFLAAGGLLMLAAVILGPGHPAEIVLPMVVYLIGVGLVMPQTMASALQPFPDRAGAASSLLGLVQMLTAATIGIGIGKTLDGGALPLPLTLAATGIASLVVFHATKSARYAT